MTVLFAGGRLESLTILTGSPMDTTGQIAGNNTWDTNYSDAALDINGGSVRLDLYNPDMSPATVGAGHAFWLHAYVWVYGPHAYIAYTFNDAAGEPWLRLYSDGNGNFLLQFNSGTALAPVWSTLGTYGTPAQGARQFDVEVQMPAEGEYIATLYLDGGATGATGAFTPGVSGGQPEVANVVLFGLSDLYFSQLLATVDQSTIGAQVKTCRATAAGTYGQWTGAYTNVNEAGDNDATADQATTAGLKQTYPMSGVVVPEGFAIATVFHWLRAKNDGSAPENIQSALITAGGEHETGNLAGVGVGYGPAGTRYDTNPDTGAVWTQAEWNTPVQLGYVSEA